MQNAADGKLQHSLNVLITGGTDGLGRATAILLASEGYRVFAAGRNAEKRASLEQLAEEQSIPLETLELDVTDDASADRAIAEAERRAGPVDVLINNAGIGIAAVMEELTLADLHKQYETNVFGVLRMTQRVLPSMRARRSGSIVNMSSIAGLISNPILGPYSSSKHALEAISDSLRLELASFGIRVILIEPGIIPTNINRTAAELSARYVENAATSPYAQVYRSFQEAWTKMVAASKATPEDCARVILKAIRAEKPRARYLVTREAKISAALRRLLPDGIMDRLTMRMLGLQQKAATPASQPVQQIEPLSNRRES